MFGVLVGLPYFDNLRFLGFSENYPAKFFITTVVIFLTVSPTESVVLFCAIIRAALKWPKLQAQILLKLVYNCFVGHLILAPVPSSISFVVDR